MPTPNEPAPAEETKTTPGSGTPSPVADPRGKLCSLHRASALVMASVVLAGLAMTFSFGVTVGSLERAPHAQQWHSHGYVSGSGHRAAGGPSFDRPYPGAVRDVPQAAEAESAPESKKALKKQLLQNKLEDRQLAIDKAQKRLQKQEQIAKQKLAEKRELLREGLADS